jgi:hypothetical protein
MLRADYIKIYNFGKKNCYWQIVKKIVLPILEYGYLLTFKQEPPPVILRNNKSAFGHTYFVKRAIADLVHTGVVSEIDIVPKVVNPVSFGQLVWQREINP